MTNLKSSLMDSDSALLPLLARRWKVDVTNLKDKEIINALLEVMLDPERVEQIWEGLNDQHRGALLTLLGSTGKETLPKFQLLYGEIRQMGKGQIEREQPDENPHSSAEALFYRGLLFKGFEQASTGARPIVYIPQDLMEILPAHKTAYEDLDSLDDIEGTVGLDFIPDGEVQIPDIEEEFIDQIYLADTSIVDDVMTLLAYVQVTRTQIVDEQLTDADLRTLMAHLIIKTPERMTFLLELAISAGLIAVSEGVASTKRAEARRWLEAKRSTQLKMLVDAWMKSLVYRELWHVPGLHPEPTGWAYDPIVGREAICEFLRDYTPQEVWWSMGDLIAVVREASPDFQRPGGDFNSWYIRDEGGNYLNGFESWDFVEAPLLEFYLYGPLHWLCLVDIGEDAARLTAYGRVFVNQEAWLQPPDPEEKVIVDPDGTLKVSRRVPRIDRFQLARFTTWMSGATTDGDPYVYKLTGDGIKRAEEQGINTGHISAFISRQLNNAPLPSVISKLLDTWQSGATANATIEQLLVLRTTSPETMDFIAGTPALRRYIGARLGPMAVVVRADQWELLREALGENGIDVQMIGL